MELINTAIVTAITAKTKARLFENVQVGDELEFSMELSGTGRGRAAYVPTIYVKNLRNMEIRWFSLNELSALLKRAFILQEKVN